ncbi:MAG: SRPBCC family protein [Boseongicola sp.]|nr:SRPBCC family protein [Boseongicola sp.]
MSCDTAFIRVRRSADEVFAFMADPANMSLWSFGTWRTEIDSAGLVRGTSIKDGAETYVRVEAHPEQRLIDYHVGTTPGSLSPRIFGRVTPEAVFGDGLGTGLALTVFRTAEMDDARWESLIAAHRVELDIVKSALETGHDHRNA